MTKMQAQTDLNFRNTEVIKNMAVKYQTQGFGGIFKFQLALDLFKSFSRIL
jgi:hypothetical protein